MTKVTDSTNVFQYINNLNQNKTSIFKSSSNTELENQNQSSSPLNSLGKSQFVSDETRSDELAKKVARGESLTEEERTFMQNHDPEKLNKAIEANNQRKDLSKQLKKAKHPSQAESIIASALSRVLLMQKSGDNIMSTLMLEGIKKESNEYYFKHPKNKSYEITDSIVKIDHINKKYTKRSHIDTLI